jgi:sporulation protein YlmC with PRC-barrel domain
MKTDAAGRPAVLRSRDFLGRDVVDVAGAKIGSVRDLLLDRRSGAIRFLEVDLGVLRNRVIVPARHVDWGEESLVLRGWSEGQIKKLPTYDADRPLTGELLDELTWAYPTFYGDDEPTAATTAPVEPQVVPISDTRDFKVPADEPDLRGWTVFGADGERVGKVADLLVDPAAMKVAFLVVDVLDDLFLLKDDRHVLIPADAVDLKERGQDVWVRSIAARDLARLPAYLGVPLDPVTLGRVDDAFHRRRE